MHAFPNLCTLIEKYARSKKFMHAYQKIRTHKLTYARSALNAQKSTAEKSLPCAKEFKTAAESAHCIG